MHIEDARTDYLRAREVEVEAERDTRVSVDGEVIGHTPVRLSVVPERSGSGAQQGPVDLVGWRSGCRVVWLVPQGEECFNCAVSLEAHSARSIPEAGHQRHAPPVCKSVALRCR